LNVLFGKNKIVDMQTLLNILKTDDINKFYQSQLKADEEMKAYKHRDRFVDLTERLEKHKKLSLFIHEYKRREQEKDKEKEDEKNRFKF